MKNKMILLVIQIVAAGLTLALTVVSFAWFMSNREVYSNSTMITAGQGISIVIDTVGLGDNEEYNGQTGLGYPSDEYGGVDSPYKFQRTIDATVRNIGENFGISVIFRIMKINKADGTVISSEDNSAVLEDFTWRLYDYSGGSPVKYGPDENNYARKIIAGSDELGDYFIPPPGQEISLQLGIEIVFANKQSYRNWEKELYDELELFPYSDYSYMRSTFIFILALQLEAISGGAA